MNICPVCNYDKLSVPAYKNIGNFTKDDIERLEPPYEDSLGTASYEVCDKCGFEFGNDDNPGTAKPSSFAQYRAEWEASGSKWFSPKSAE